MRSVLGILVGGCARISLCQSALLIDLEPIRVYLLRCVLKGTTGLGRNNVRISEMMVPTSSRTKSNNIVEWNKLNSDF